MRVALKVRLALGAEEQVWAQELGPLHMCILCPVANTATGPCVNRPRGLYYRHLGVYTYLGQSLSFLVILCPAPQATTVSSWSRVWGFGALNGPQVLFPLRPSACRLTLMCLSKWEPLGGAGSCVVVAGVQQTFPVNHLW